MMNSCLPIGPLGRGLGGFVSHFEGLRDKVADDSKHADAIGIMQETAGRGE
jgi:hypothetical protein